MIFYNKYLKYKNKYIKIKNVQKGGLNCDNELVFKNTIGTCWMVAIQNMLVFGDNTKNFLEEILNNISKKQIYDIKEIICEKKYFIDKQIQDVKNNSNLNNILPTNIFDLDKIDYLKKILNSFIDRYYSKIFKIKNNEQPDISSIEYKQGRCEMLINQNFKKLFEEYSNDIDEPGGDLVEQYLFINILSIFLLNYKVSFINYYKDNYKDINYNNSNFLGIIIHIEKHACCFFICNNLPKYYNDNNKITYDCDWIALLKETDKDLYIINHKYIEELKKYVIALTKDEFENYSDFYKIEKIIYLTVVTKNKNCDLDQQMNIILYKKENDFNKISDSLFLFYIGLDYDIGSHKICKNIDKAIEFYNKSIKYGYNEAIYNLGIIYEEDKKNIELAIKLYTEAALNGKIKSMIKLANIYHKNEKYKNINYANYWYTKLLKYEEDTAQFYFANKYETGDDNSQNFCEAIYLYTKLLKKYKNDDVIQYKLGINYYNLGNYTEALIWLKKAGENNIDAQLKLAQIYKEGIDNYNYSDYNEAIKWYKKAVDKGNTDALTNIGLIYEELSNIDPDNIKNKKLAFEYYNKAACLNDRNAQYYLSKMYKNGKYVEKNKIEAIKWLKQSGKNGNNDASYELGIYYINKDNDDEGIEWLTLAAINKHVNSQYKLGIYSYNKKNYVKAFEWLTKAAEQNNIDAQVYLGNMYYEGIGTKEDITKALYWYNLAADQGNFDAQNILFNIDPLYKSKYQKSSRQKDKKYKDIKKTSKKTSIKREAKNMIKYDDVLL
jgi:TPR repeat protein